MNIYVGNLPYSVTEKELTDLFEAYGSVKSVKVITDKPTGRSKGFGFVEMENDEEALNAIKELDNKEIENRRIRATQARSEGGAPQGGGNRSDFRQRDSNGAGRRPFNSNRGGSSSGSSNGGGYNSNRGGGNGRFGM